MSPIEALNRIAQTWSSDWPEQCRENVRLARTALATPTPSNGWPDTDAEQVASVTPAEPQTRAVVDVLAERCRQIEAEGWTPEHDDTHGKGSLAYAAAAFAVSSAGPERHSFFITSLWAWTGWARSWFKPKSPREDLVRAGALILAEIERLDRAAMAAKEST